MIALRMERVTKRFATSGLAGSVAIADLSLTIPQGQFVMIIGPNGSGKSTLLNLAGGALSPEEGRILVRHEGDGEQDWTRLPARLRGKLVGRIYQDPAWGTASGMSVAEHLSLASMPGAAGLFGRGVTAQSHKNIAQQLASTSLGGKEDAQADELSYGQRQLLTLEMATHRGAKLLLLDEPTASLDRRNAALCMARVAELQTKLAPTILMVTHDMAIAATFGDRLLVLAEGGLRADIFGDQKKRLTPEDVFRLCGFGAVGSGAQLERPT